MDIIWKIYIHRKLFEIARRTKGSNGDLSKTRLTDKNVNETIKDPFALYNFNITFCSGAEPIHLKKKSIVDLCP